MINLIDALFMAAMTVIAGCMQTQKEIQIRVQNNGIYDLTNVKVTSPASGETEYGSISANQSSEYRKHTNSYPMAAITAKIGDQNVHFIPDDYLGEQHLKSGKYTFSITVIEAQGKKHLRLKLIVDEP
jgi:hypothetical protein